MWGRECSYYSVVYEYINPYVEGRDSTVYPGKNIEVKNQVESKRQHNAPVPGRNY